MEHLLALLKSNSTSGTPSVSVAHTGNELYAPSCRFKSTPWIIDSGASNHMTNSSNMFESYSPCPGNKKDRSSGKTIGSARMINEEEILRIKKNRNNLEPVVYSRKKVSGRSKDQLIIPAHGQPKALGNGSLNASGNPPFVPAPIHTSSSPVTDLSLLSHFDPSPEISAPEPGLGLAPVVPAQDLDLDLPIALRKGTRACTKHPIAKYISYSNLSDNYRAFTTNISKLVVPRNIQEALDEPSWKLAVFEEMNALKKNGTWEVVDLPKEKKLDDCNELKKLKGKLAEEFEIKDLGALKYFLGMEFARSKEEANVKLQPTKAKNVKDRDRYQRLVGRLIYLFHTHLDIAFSDPKVSKGTLGRGLMFKSRGHLQIEAYTDADWARSIVDRRSTSGYFSFVGDNLVTWRSKKQNVVARSSAEVEFRAVAHVICEIMWIRRLLEELKMTGSSPMKLYCDNKAAILVAHNLVLHDCTKHVEVDKHFIKEKIDNGLVCMTDIPTEEQVANVFTKGLHKRQFDFLVGKLAMEDIFKPA
ncbi:Retrovirus-related Pol polyprotein from transposon RE1 [Vitis vinifera]|uniref:Retrovirus-related Pol polyprotein from transposon RE1 n=1 Tax=Vitis vinifera TaxID=29760 RepID=A0A438HWH1_VITVI|nr:Retrovirus-related Pol polyprotein from transposon RE1 [Vitis vinifera]